MSVQHDDEIVIGYLPGPRRQPRLRYRQASPIKAEPLWQIVAQVVAAAIVTTGFIWFALVLLLAMVR